MPKRVKCYHIKDGETSCFEVDARERALAHPEEWSMTPWPAKKADPKLMTADDAKAKAEAELAAKKKAEEDARAKAEAEAKAKAEAEAKS